MAALVPLLRLRTARLRSRVSRGAIPGSQARSLGIGLLLVIATVGGRAEALAGEPEAHRGYVPADKRLAAAWLSNLVARGERKVYRGAELETIGMPCGGIGCGQLYVRGDGTLAQWWIDNTYYDSGYGHPGTTKTPMGTYPIGYQTQPQRPPSPVRQGFAVAIRPAGQPPMVRRLDREGFDDLGFVGEYPIATVLYASKERPPLPIEIHAEVFSPWIPLDTRNSANPATVLRYTLRNTAGRPLDVAIGGWLENLVWLGREDLPGAQRRNQVVTSDGLVAVRMDLAASPEHPLPARHPQLGEVVLAALDRRAAACAGVRSVEAFLEALGEGRYESAAARQAPLNQTLLGTVVSEMHLEPGQSRTADFLVTWCFPHRVLVVPNPYPESGTEVGNRYGNWYSNALEVAEYVQRHFDRLDRDTHLFRDTYYDTTLPYWFVQRVAMPASTLATETVQWWRNGRFWGWEGVGSCLGTCGHVYNPAQVHARLFPELARSTRLLQDLGPAFDAETGRIGFRGVKGTSTAVTTGNWGYAADAQCGYVLKLYREHLLSPDRAFLDRVWPQTRQALEYLIGRDGNADGVLEDQQHTTWDMDLFGPNSYVGTYYLAALRAGEEMARVQGEESLATRYHEIFERGRRFALERLWNGEYFIHLPPRETPNPATTIAYGTGCLSHQLAGQTWAYQVGLGRLYPQDQVVRALQSVYRYNWTPDVADDPAYPNIGPRHPEYPRIRRFALPGEGGLFECTWPKGDPPAIPILHNAEVWTGTEYSVAALMLHEGMVSEGLTLVRTVHDRYAAAKRNPWNEIECGDHYARAMASWACLIAASGFGYDGPAGTLGFAPRLTPEAFRCFFSAAEGWGSLAQERQAHRQQNRLEVQWGRLRLRTLRLELPPEVKVSSVELVAAGAPQTVQWRADGPRLVIDLAREVVIERGQGLRSAVAW